jgi:putative Holliday junction resolvase
MSQRIIAVDPGEKRLGIAISDPNCLFASPLTVIKHINMAEDCSKIIALAKQNGRGHCYW